MPNLLLGIAGIEIEESLVFYNEHENLGIKPNLFERLTPRHLVMQLKASLYTTEHNEPIKGQTHVALTQEEAAFIVSRLVILLPSEVLQERGIEVKIENKHSQDYEY